MNYQLYPEEKHRPAISPDLGRSLPAFSLLYRLSGFHVKISGKIIILPAFFFFFFFFFFQTTFSNSQTKLKELNVN